MICQEKPFSWSDKTEHHKNVQSNLFYALSYENLHPKYQWIKGMPSLVEKIMMTKQFHIKEARTKYY